MRRHCERRQRGVQAVVQIEVGEQFVQWLIAEGWLEAQDSDGKTHVTKAAVAEALDVKLNNWAES